MQMTKKNLWIVLILMMCGILWAVSGIVITNKNMPHINNGRLLFAQTAEKQNISKIVVTTPETSITFEADNKMWLVKESDYYYANIELLNMLLDDFHNARYIGKQTFNKDVLGKLSLLPPADGQPGEGTLIETFDEQNQKLNAIIIGQKNKKNGFYFVRPENKDEIWFADGTFLLPAEIYSWLMQPLFEFPANIFDTITVTHGNQSISAERTDNRAYFFSNGQIVFPQAVLERFSYLIAENVLSAQNFDETLFPRHKQIVLTTFNGLKLSVDMFYDSQNYWVKLTLSPMVLSTAAVNAYIKDNAFRYDGWYFKIPRTTGEVFANFNIM